MRSRRTIFLTFLAILLFVIPAAFGAGESSDCSVWHSASSKHQSAPPSGMAEVDVCTMVDFGIYPWMRYSFMASLFSFFVAAISFSADKSARGKSVTIDMKAWIRANPVLTLGVLITPIACIVALASSGYGHGSYIAARILLPVACACFGEYEGASIAICVLALAQWPAYGWILDRAKKKMWAIAAICTAHITLCVWLFTKGAERFN